MPSSTTHPRSTLVLVAALLAGCGGAQPEPLAGAPTEPEAPPPDVAAPLEPPPASPEPEPEPTAEAEQAPPARDPDAQREVRYIQTQEGLRVEVDKVRFLAKAEPVRTQAGFHVRVTVSATAEESRSLLSPKNGPLAFAGSVKRAGKAEAETFGDAREGDGEEPLGEGTTVKLTRDFPPKGVRPLGNGDSLELDVGLWGLGTSPSDRRAVKLFARVKASVQSWQGKATILPPPSVKGK
jgi:hypothetical protein